MRVLLQRVKYASVKVDGKTVGKIEKGLLVFIGVKETDNDNSISYLADKVSRLRIFEDENEKMNLSVKDIEGEILVISQFTLYANCQKGRRPSFVEAANPDFAKKQYEKFIEVLKKESGLKVESGIFAADMKVELLNDGPVTIMIESKE